MLSLTDISTRTIIAQVKSRVYLCLNREVKATVAETARYPIGHLMAEMKVTIISLLNGYCPFALTRLSKFKYTPLI